MHRIDKEFNMVLLLLVIFTTLVPTTVTETTGSCINSYSTHKNGDIFFQAGNKCVKYKCNNGVKETIQEGCEKSGKCYNVDSTFLLYCKTYQCSKTVTDGATRYSTPVVDSMCMTTDGQCHKVGETFSYKKKNKTYSNCTCRLAAGGDVTIDCKG